jgi:tetratricopeptide (TPR) repeat protein
MDQNNPVVKLCVEGMRAEGEGRYEEARGLFTKAWETATDDFEACIAAHYVARHQENPEETLRWNQESLRRAQAVSDDRVRDFYPSLFLNLGASYERVGNMKEGQRYYTLASQSSSSLPDDRYGHIVRNAIAAGVQRVDSSEE